MATLEEMILLRVFEQIKHQMSEQVDYLNNSCIDRIIDEDLNGESSNDDSNISDGSVDNFTNVIDEVLEESKEYAL